MWPSGRVIGLTIVDFSVLLMAQAETDTASDYGSRVIINTPLPTFPPPINYRATVQAEIMITATAYAAKAPLGGWPTFTPRPTRTPKPTSTPDLHATMSARVLGNVATARASNALEGVYATAIAEATERAGRPPATPYPTYVPTLTPGPGGNITARYKEHIDKVAAKLGIPSPKHHYCGLRSKCFSAVSHVSRCGSRKQHKGILLTRHQHDYACDI